MTVSGTAENANTPGVVQPAAQTLTITDDDEMSTTATLTVSPASVAENAMGAARTVTVTATLDKAARTEAAEVTVSVSGGTATAGTDYTAVAPFTVTIDAGAKSGTGTFDLVPIDDAMDEPDETVKVTGTTAASGLSVVPGTGVTVILADNEPDPVASLVLTPAAIAEDTGSSTVTATLGPAVERGDNDHHRRDAGGPGDVGRLHPERDDAHHRGGEDGEHRDGDDRGRRQRRYGGGQAGDGVGHGGEFAGRRPAGGAEADDHRRRVAVDDGDADRLAVERGGGRDGTCADGDGDRLPGRLRAPRGDAGRGDGRGRHGGGGDRLHPGGRVHGDDWGGGHERDGDLRAGALGR